MEKKAILHIMLVLVLTNALSIGGSAQQSSSIGEIIYSVPSPDRNATCGLEWDGAALWITDAYLGTIYRFDPFTNTTLSILRGPTGYLRELAWDGANLWVASWDFPRSIYKLNPIDGSVIASFPAPFSGHPDGLAWDGNYLWIGEEDGKIYKVDPSTGQVIYSFSVPLEAPYNPRGLAWDGEHLWVGYQDVGLIREHDITTGYILTTFASPAGYSQQGLAWDGRCLWSTGNNNYIYQIKVKEAAMKVIFELSGTRELLPPLSPYPCHNFSIQIRIFGISNLWSWRVKVRGTQQS